MTHIRLRHVAVVTADLAGSVDTVQQALRLPEPFNDDLANQFSTHNAVFSLGNTFLEICSPYDDGPVRRYAEERGGEAGYMAVFQVPDNDRARARLDELGVRIIAELKLFDQGANMLHPKDVPGAMVSIDWATPYESWRWGGPAWSGRVPEHPEGGIVSIEVRMLDAHRAAEKWALALDAEVETVSNDEAHVHLPETGQVVRFATTKDKLREGICAVELTLPSEIVVKEQFDVAGVHFTCV